MDNQDNKSAGKYTPETPAEVKVEKVYKDAFNVSTQQVEPHVVTIAKNGEIVLTAEDGTFIKFPGDFNKEQLEKALEEYQEANIGQVKAEDEELANQEKLNSLV